MSRRIILRNSTAYDGRIIRRWLHAAIEERGVEHLTCEVLYSRQGDHRGYGYLGIPHIKLLVPRDGNVSRVRVAQILLHEIDHTLGLRHREMRSSRHLDFAWSDSLPEWRLIPPRERKPRGRARPVGAKLEWARARAKEAQTRAKRANTILKKWQAKVRYYERRQAQEVQ